MGLGGLWRRLGECGSASNLNRSVAGHGYEYQRWCLVAIDASDRDCERDRGCERTRVAESNTWASLQPGFSPRSITNHLASLVLYIKMNLPIVLNTPLSILNNAESGTLPAHEDINDVKEPPSGVF